jgi:hypothetical protein
MSRSAAAAAAIHYKRSWILTQNVNLCAITECQIAIAECQIAIAM